VWPTGKTLPAELDLFETSHDDGVRGGETQLGSGDDFEGGIMEVGETFAGVDVFFPACWDSVAVV
jgi:hypothetical protein